MSRLPIGTVTFLFTDIEGSTRLVQDLGDNVSEQVLADHRRLLKEAVESAGGNVYQDQGESFVFVFPRARGAVLAAIAVQRALRDHTWPEGHQLRVRTGLHTGEPVGEVGEYVGLDVHRAARICEVGHGGQILLSQTAHDLVVDDFPEDLDYRDMGEHRLKDLARPVHLFQVVVPDLPADFPVLRSLDVLPNNLPRQLTSFIGREREIEEIEQLIFRTPMLTLTGVGGVGKTRLALQVAAEVLEDFKDGVWLVELASLSDPNLVPQAVASSLGVREQPGRQILDTLRDFLQPKALLLVMDNVERLINACAHLADGLLKASRGIRILATSRERLGIGGETAWPVPPLTMPDPRHLPPLEALGDYEAVRLFVERAKAVRPMVALTKHNASWIAQICHRLDGIPLAIELAAARVDVLSLKQIATRLDDWFSLLTAGGRTTVPRHQTLEAAIDWSHDLLLENELILLRRLAVFSGGWTLEAAETVCSGGGIETGDVLDLLTHLVNKSLVMAESQGPEARYRLLETIWQYAEKKLVESGEADSQRRAHLEYFVALAEQADAQLRGSAHIDWLAKLDTEHDNLRAALGWSQTHSKDAAAGLHLAGALQWFWYMRENVTEGREWLQSTLSRGASAAPAVRAKALMGLGMLAWRLDDFSQARASLEEALAVFRGLGDETAIAFTLHHLAHVLQSLGSLDQVIAMFQDSVARFRTAGLKMETGWSLNCLASAMRAQGEDSRAAPLLEESLALLREAGGKWGLAHPLGNLAGIAEKQGDYKRATALLEESLTISRETGDKWGVATAMQQLGNLAFRQGNYEQAAKSYKENLVMRIQLGDRAGVSTGLGLLARLALAQVGLMRAARLLGAADVVREAIGMALSPPSRIGYDRTVAKARAALGDQAFETGFAEGRAMTLEQTIEYALSE